MIFHRKKRKSASWVAIRLDMYKSFHFHISEYTLLSSYFIFIKGREDNNIDTIRKRFKVFLESSLPIIEYFTSKEKVRKVMLSIFRLKKLCLIFGGQKCNFLTVDQICSQIDSSKPVGKVFEAVKAIFTPVVDKVK